MKSNNCGDYWMKLAISGVSLCLILVGPADAQSSATLEKAGKSYKDAAASLASVGEKSVSKTYRTRVREVQVGAYLHYAFLTGAYRESSPLPEPPGAVEMLCAPQYRHREIEDSSKALKTIGDVVGELSAKSGKKGFQLFVYEATTDRNKKRKKKAQEEPAQPEPEIVIRESALNALNAFQENALSFPNALENVADATVCDTDLTDESMMSRMSGAHRDLCACAEIAKAAESYFAPGRYQPRGETSQEGGPVAIATFVKGFFAALDKIFGVFGQKLEAAKIKKAVHNYVSSEETKRAFDRAITMFEGELKTANRVSQRNAARAYWRSYCQYVDTYVHYEKVVIAARTGEELPTRNKASRPTVNSNDTCAHIAAQRDLQFNPQSSSKNKKTPPRPVAEDLALDAAYRETQKQFQDTLKKASLFDTAFDAPSSETANKLRKSYNQLVTVSSPGYQGDDNEWARLISEMLWIAEAVLAVDAGKTDLEKAFDDLEKALKEDEE